MSQLNVWKSVLSPNHIYDLATSCKHASGDVLAWADFSEQSHGSVVKTEPSIACDCKFSFLINFHIPYEAKTDLSSSQIDLNFLVLSMPTFFSRSWFVKGELPCKELDIHRVSQ